MNTTRNDALMDGWLDWLAAGDLSPNTIRNRRSTMGTFARQHDLMTATTDDILAHLRGLPGGAWSRAGHLSAIRSFYTWAQGMGHRADNPAAMVRSVKTHDRTGPALTSGTLDRAILLAPDALTRNALLLGSRAGLRREEIASFHSDCVRGDELVIVGKGSKERHIPIHPDLRPLCDSLARQPGWLFPSTRKPGCHVTPETIQRAVSAALGEPYTTHDLRRFAATAWYNGTRDLRAVQELLGHSSPETTAKYVRPNTDAMRRAVLSVA